MTVRATRPTATASPRRLVSLPTWTEKKASAARTPSATARIRFMADRYPNVRQPNRSGPLALTTIASLGWSGPEPEGSEVVRRALVVLVAFLFWLGGTLAASAAAGDIDTTFGEQGIAPGFAGPFSSAHDVAVLSDGRLVEVGYSASESQPYFGIAASGSFFTAGGDLLGGFGVARGILNAYHEVVPYPGGGAVIAGWAQRCLAG